MYTSPLGDQGHTNNNNNKKSKCRQGLASWWLAGSPESRCLAAGDAGEGAERRLERAPIAHAAGVHAAARGQLQSSSSAASLEMARVAGGGACPILLRAK